MASKINGLESKPVRGTAPESAVQRRPNPPPAPPAAANGAAGSDVQLTGAARNLSTVAQSLFGKPAIDEARVANVKARLADGSYEIDPQRVADKLLRVQGDLARLSPLDKSSLLK